MLGPQGTHGHTMTLQGTRAARHPGEGKCSPLCSSCPELTFRPHTQPCKTKIRVEERWDSMLELISQCWRNDACPAWAQGLPCTKQLQHVTYSGSPGSFQFRVKQCKIPQPIFSGWKHGEQPEVQSIITVLFLITAPVRG